jgi:hypothetical protein
MKLEGGTPISNTRENRRKYKSTANVDSQLNNDRSGSSKGNRDLRTA